MTSRPGLALLALLATTAPAAGPAVAQSCTCPPVALASGPVIEAEAPPPPLPEETQPPIPAPGYIWTPGYWYWNNVDYYYVPGVWVEPPHPGLLWTPGFWAFAGGLYRFTHGTWGPQVGFYGGIPYGHGYDGVGYQGGRWTGNTFFYNRTVNNFGGVHVTNVYDQTVNHFDGPRVSYNGGPGGIDRRPDAAQAAYLHGPHEAPTPMQMQHLRAAGMVPGAFDAINRGHPAPDELRNHIHETADRLPPPSPGMRTPLPHAAPPATPPHPAPRPAMEHPSEPVARPGMHQPPRFEAPRVETPRTEAPHPEAPHHEMPPPAVHPQPHEPPHGPPHEAFHQAPHEAPHPPPHERDGRRE
ncbi:hypothetical protein FHR90_000340 [Endobacter medicaginis]|uniref:YXWGXW repeat-containing protein n=2 Tax=Endobacter medicaginis TaxID=1181271 RepID=A0A839UVX8_9PROT|nr:YXWGXW repeat-containing protein [Endobacter medicaginis]MBB3172534.1 hypothetical protein [Endobacter medicaginis]MCX5473978.1 YXWGXW repeat-containing protein [Endobacter medicaginis]